MTPDFIGSFAKEAVIVTLMVGAPMLGIGLIIGIIVSIFQTITSINEITLVFVPKIVAVLVALIIFFPWMMEIMMNFTLNLFQNLHMYVK
jgi:flagellar biosynthetic protein FliQ